VKPLPGRDFGKSPMAQVIKPRYLTFDLLGFKAGSLIYDIANLKILCKDYGGIAAQTPSNIFSKYPIAQVIKPSYITWVII